MWRAPFGKEQLVAIVSVHLKVGSGLVLNTLSVRCRDYRLLGPYFSK